MLEKLTLLNFQSHLNSELTFDKGVNVIVGPSDSGKTAIIRALRWLVWGRPLGDAFIHHGKDVCKVSVTLDGHKVSREKVKGGEGSYQFLDRGYTALKTEVPEEIKRFFNISEINLQQQLDRPFLLDSSPGEVAQHFNRVAHLDAIDIGMKRIIGWIRKLNQDSVAKDQLLEEMERELAQYDSLDVLDARVTVLEQVASQLSSLQSRKESLNMMLKKVEEIDGARSTYRAVVRLDGKVNSVVTLFSEKKEKKEQVLSLSRTIESFDKLVKKEKEQSLLLPLEKKINNILSLYDERDKLERKRGELHGFVFNHDSVAKRLQLQEKKAAELEQEFKEKFPPVCPLCGQKVRK